MKEYTRTQLEKKVDVILDNIVDDRDIKELRDKFTIWLCLEWTSGTINAADLMYIKDYGNREIETLHALRN